MQVLQLGCIALAALIAVGAATTQSLSVTPHSEAVPDEIAPPVKALMASSGTKVKAGEATLDFWWVKALPVSGPTAGWSAVEEGSLVGIFRVEGRYRDVRGRTIKPGAYTLRYAVQPENGDHLGVSRHRTFLLMSPFAVDTSAEPAGHDGTVDLSKQTIGISHPAVLSIDPPSTTEPPSSLIKRDEEPLEGVVFEVPLAHEGKPAGALRFGLILLGKIDA